MERDAEQGIVEIERLGDVDVIRLLGEHDMATAANVADVVGRSIASERGVVVSLADTEFVDSGVVNLLFKSDRILRERGQRLVLHVQTASIVKRTLDLMNVSDSLPWSADIDAAVALATTSGSDSSWTSA